MKLKFLMRSIMFKPPGRSEYKPEYAIVVNTEVGSLKDKLYISGATKQNKNLNVIEGWKFYDLRKL